MMMMYNLDFKFGERMCKMILGEEGEIAHIGLFHLEFFANKCHLFQFFTFISFFFLDRVCVTNKDTLRMTESEFCQFMDVQLNVLFNTPGRKEMIAERFRQLKELRFHDFMRLLLDLFNPEWASSAASTIDVTASPDRELIAAAFEALER